MGSFAEYSLFSWALLLKSNSIRAYVLWCVCAHSDSGAVHLRGTYHLIQMISDQRRMWDESMWVFATWIRGIRHFQRSFPLIKWLFCGKWPMNVAHLTWFKHITYSNDHIQMSFEYVMCLNHVRCATFIGHFPHTIHYVHIHTYIHVYNVFFYISHIQMTCASDPSGEYIYIYIYIYM